MKTCPFDGCDRQVRARGLCRAHYEQQNRGEELSPIRYRTPSEHGGKGNGWICNGYRVRYVPGHPNANITGRIQEHRLIMSEHLDRPLLKNETVHHKNGDRQDNRIENLELWSSRHPKGQSIDDQVKDALEILKQYAPEYLR